MPQPNHWRPVIIIRFAHGLSVANKLLEGPEPGPSRFRGFGVNQCLRREQKAPENATHPKTQVIDRFQNQRFRVCCVFGCSLFPSKRAPKHTRKRNTPENADSGNGRLLAFSGVLRFRVLFGACQTFRAELPYFSRQEGLNSERGIHKNPSQPL